MDIAVVVLLSLAAIWLVLHELNNAGGLVPRGIAILSVSILGLIVGIDWLAGRRAILGHPGSFIHTLLKLVLAFLLVSLVGSGLTAIRLSRNFMAALLNLAWSAGLVAIVLRFMGVW